MLVKRNQIKKIEEYAGGSVLFAEGWLEVRSFNGIYTAEVQKSGFRREIFKLNGFTKELTVSPTSDENEAQEALDLIKREMTF